MKQQKRITLCLVAGVLVLAVSAAATFGSTSGYSKLKEGTKTLLLSTDNVTLQATGSLSVDGVEMVSGQIDYALAGSEFSFHSATYSKGDTAEEEYYEAHTGGVNTWFYPENDYYYAYPDDSSNSNNGLLDYDPDDEMNRRIVNFLEIAADTVVGDLKNNVVQIGSQDGVDLYQVTISQSQVPALVSAGLSLIAYDNTVGNSWNLEFADWSVSMVNYYEKTTGETLSDDVRAYFTGSGDLSDTQINDIYANNADLINKVDMTCYPDEGDPWTQQYQDVLEAHNGGVVYVHEDGSYDYYAAATDFVAAHPEESASYLEYYIGQDLSLDNVSCTFGIDQQGRLTQGQVQADFTTTDSAGTRHQLTFAAEMTATDYGTTVVQPLDTGDRTQYVYGEEESAEITTETTTETD